MGGGHVFRCLALADELRRQGAETMFVAAQMLDTLAQRIEASRHAMVRIAPPGALDDDRSGWEEGCWVDEEQHADVRQTEDATGNCDWIVLDHYKLNSVWSGAARAFARNILAVDDLANRPHDCDLLLDQTLGRATSDYSRLVPQAARVLTGPFFALLRPEFAAARRAALAARFPARAPARLLISLGSTDIGGCTEAVLDAALSLGIDTPIDVLFGTSGAVGLLRARRLAGANANVTVHDEAADVARLMAEADVAIGAAGVSSWERCCLGLPAVTLVVAENQRLLAHSLRSADAALAAASPEKAASEAAALLDDPHRRLAMTAAAAAVTDGRGVERVAAIILGDTDLRAMNPPLLRPVTIGDCERLWLWRNDVAMRAMAKSPTVIPWPDHVDWFNGRIANPNGLFLVAECGREPVGTVRFDRQDGRKSFLVSVNLASEWRGGGLGARILIDACAAFDRAYGCHPLEAEIRCNNPSSQRIFLAAGFRSTGSADGAYLQYRRPPASG